MWVKCQNEMVIDVKNFYVMENNIGGFGIHKIVDGYNVSTLYGSVNITLGNYETKDKADAVLSDMVEHINKTDIYKMPQTEREDFIDDFVKNLGNKYTSNGLNEDYNK